MLEAFAWGAFAGSALLFGAFLGYLARLPRWAVATVMGFGSGVLLSAVSFELITQAHEAGGLALTAIGAGVGAVVYTAANVALAFRGARHRKRSAALQPSEQQQSGSGTAIALGAVLDGIPESVVIGTSLIAGGGISVTTVVAVFISNVPEGLSSAVGMRRAGRSAQYIFGLWIGVTVVSGLAALAGFGLLDRASTGWISGITAFAAGAILAMIADTMIPEAFDDAGLLTGLTTVAGFLTSFGLSAL
jgi:ZIP family zinc transporter